MGRGGGMGKMTDYDGGVHGDRNGGKCYYLTPDRNGENALLRATTKDLGCRVTVGQKFVF